MKKLFFISIYSENVAKLFLYMSEKMSQNYSYKYEWDNVVKSFYWKNVAVGKCCKVSRKLSC